MGNRKMSLSRKKGRPDKTQSVSLCMIVKDEGEFLENCLASVRDYVDEIIIVDTGSTDNTVEIAKKFTDKVHFHPWEDSFGKARNHALQYATGLWIFQMDADEELMQGSGDALNHAIRDAGDADIIYVNLLCTYAKGLKISYNFYERIFRNNGKIHYEGNVHEQVIGGTKAVYSNITLWHYGYDLNEEKTRNKFTRTTNLLKREIEKEPDNPVHHHHLSASYASLGMDESALAEAVMAIELSDSQQNNHDLFAWSHFIASMACYRLGQVEKAKEYAVKSLKKYTAHLDACYILTIISADEGRWDDAIKYGQSYMETLKNIDSTHKGRLIIENTINEGSHINTLLGHAYHAKKLSSKMLEYYNSAYETKDLKWQALWDIGTYHLDKSNDLELAGYYLDRAAKEAPDEYNVWYMLAKLYNKQGLNREELECLERVARIRTDDPFILDRILKIYIDKDMCEKAMELISDHGDKLTQAVPMLCKLAVMHLEKGSMEQAVRCYMMAVEKDPNLFEAWASLGEITLTLKRFEEAEIFFNRALGLKLNDTGIMLGLCEIGARRGDVDSVVACCDILLGTLDLPRDRIISGIDDIRSILIEIDVALKKGHLSTRINNIINIIS